MDNYDFDNDEEFQSGLKLILLKSENDQHSSQLIQSAKKFYYENKVNNDQQFLSFDQVTKLILENKTHLIPNIKSIPNVILEHLQPHTQSSSSQPLKPWELTN